MKIEKVVIMGMEQERWTHASCVGEFGVGEDWATLYYIESQQRRKGHASQLLKVAKKYYEGQGKKFGGSVALNDNMARIYNRLGITEYKDEEH